MTTNQSWVLLIRRFRVNCSKQNNGNEYFNINFIFFLRIRDLEKELLNWQNKYNTEIQNWTNKYNTEMANWTNKYNTEIGNLTSKWNTERQ